MNIATVSIDGDFFMIATEKWDKDRVKSIPDIKWSPIYKLWKASCTVTNAKHIDKFFSSEEIDELAKQKITELKNFKKEILEFPSDFQFKNPPMSCQSTALELAYPHNGFALFMDMGTGKTYTSINLAAARFLNDQIDAVLVVCPTSVKPVWPDEFKEHCPVPYIHRVHESSKANERRTTEFIDKCVTDLKVLVIGVEALSNGRAFEFAENFCKAHKVMMVIDESSTIKTPPKYKGGQPAKSRTVRCWDLGALSLFRIILSGTPVTQGVQDLFSQFTFLDWEIIGKRNFASFRSDYCTMGGFDDKKITGYKNLDKLFDKLRPWTYSVKITDVLDMPEQTYEKVHIKANPDQARMLKDLGDPYDMTTEMNGVELEVETILERMIRYQQIVGGFFPFPVTKDNGEPDGYEVVQIKGSNPKLEELLTIIGRLDDHKKIIIWARFAPEQKLIDETLRQKYGENSSVHYGGGGSTELRTEMIEQFREGDARFFVSGAAGYRGLTLVESCTVIYYSNTFSYDDREQSERRPWRIGQKNAVLYIDLVMNHKIDNQILTALRNKQDVAEFVNGELSGS